MSTLLTPQRVPVPDKPSRPKPPAVEPSLVASGVAFLPLLLPFGAQTWIRPHYEFSPLAILGAVVLIRQRWPAAGNGSRWAAVPAALAALAAVALAWAAWQRSTFPVPVALVLFTAAVACAAGGLRQVVAWWPALALLVLIARLPFAWDFALLGGLRHVTTAVGSRILDGLGYPHVLNGNVLEVGPQRLLVEDACSGINSLFSTLACTLFLSGVARRGGAHTAALVVAAAGWVLAANATRVVLVVAAAGRGLDLAGGWRHDLLGVGTYALGLALTLSTDRLLLALYRPRGGPAEPPAPPPAAPATLRVPGGWLTAGVLAALAATHVSVFWDPVRASLSGTGRDLLTRAEGLRRESLPAAGPGWSIEAFETFSRNPGSQFGDYSRTWTGRCGRWRATVSFDYPFREWHNLEVCYIAQGWAVDGYDAFAMADGGRGHRLRLTRPGSVHGAVFFTEFDPTGRSLQPPQAMPGNPAGEALPGGYFGTVFQLQVCMTSPGPLSAEDEAAATDLLAAARRAVLAELGVPDPYRP